MNILNLLKIIKLYIFNNINLYKEYYYILSFFLKKDLSWIITNLNYKINKNDFNNLFYIFLQRLKGIPISYIFNKCYFLNSSYLIYNDIFIPRKDTEIMVKYCINLIRINNFYNILDLGTGSGVISISIAKRISYVNIIGIDINLLAIKLAKYNSKIYKLNNIYFYRSNWFNNIKNKKFHVIITNPPYINKYSKEYFNDLRFESKISLFSKNNGLNDIKYIILNSYNYLLNYGWLIIEHCFSQINIINYLLSKNKYFNIKNYKDYNNFFRFTVAQKII